MNLEWYCCNKCYAKLIKAEKPFSLTQCGHIFCSSCIKGAQTLCPQCKTTNVASMQLNIPLEPRLSVFFSPAETMIDNIQKTIKFQNIQMAICMKQFVDTIDKYKALKKEYWVAVQKLGHMKKKVKALEEEIAHKEMSIIKQKRNHHSAYYQGQDVSRYLPTPSNMVTPTSMIRKKLSHVQFSSDDNTPPPSYSNNGFRVPTSTHVPRSSRRSSGGSTGSQKRTPFSDYSPNSSG